MVAAQTDPAPTRILWYRADDGVTTNGAGNVTVWADQSGNGFDATDANAPSFVSSLAGLNGQPALRFDRANDESLRVPGDDLINGDPDGFPRKTITIVFRTGSNVTDLQMIYEQGGGGSGFNVYLNGGEVVASAWDGGWGQFSVREGVSANTSYVLTFAFDKDATNQLELFLNGTSVDTASDPVIDVVSSHGNPRAIGNISSRTQLAAPDVAGSNDLDVSSDTLDAGFDGHIAEFVSTNEALNTAQRQILESDLSRPYFSGTTTPTFATLETAGIGRYDFTNFIGYISGVGQESSGSTSQDEGRSGLLSLVGTSLANGDFAMVGHNRQPETFIVDEDPSNIDERFDRVWRYDPTGSPQFDIEFDVSSFSVLASGQEYKLLVQTDPSFTGSTTVVNGTLSGGTFTVANAHTQLSGGDYFTLAKTSVDGPSTLSYSPNPLQEFDVDLPVSASATVSGNNMSVSYTISAGSDNSNGTTTVTYGPDNDSTTENIEIDPSTGEITVTSSTPVGSYTATVEATDADGTTEFVDVLRIDVQQEVTLSYDVPSQVLADTNLTITPAVATVPGPPEGDITFALVEDEITAAGLSLNSMTGEISGTITGGTDPGLRRAVVEATGTGTAVGTVTAEVNIAVIGGNGPAGIGDVATDPADDDVTESTILDLDASDLVADDGDRVKIWPDSSGYANDMEANDGVSPVYRAQTAGLNDRPALDFSGTSASYLMPGSRQFDNGGPFAQRTLTTVFRTGSSIPTGTGSLPEAIWAEGGGNNGVSIYLRNDDLYVGMYSRGTGWGPYFFRAASNDLTGSSSIQNTDPSDDGGAGTVAINPNTAYVVTLTLNAATSELSAYVNGTLIGRQDTDVEVLDSHRNAAIGATNGGDMLYDDGRVTYDPFTGQIGEAVAYGVELTDAQRQILESSLGAKYGIAVAPNRFDFASTEEFDTGTEVVGVGQLADNDFPHDPAVASSILTATPSAALTDGDFTLLGHNGEPTIFASDDQIPDADDSDASDTDFDRVEERLSRVWRVDLNGGSVDFDIEVDVSDLSLGTDQEFVLVIDDDADIDDTNGGTTVLRPNPTGANDTDSTWTRAALSGALSDGDYVTLGRTVGQLNAPTNLTYDPAPLRAQVGTVPQSSIPSVDAQPAPTYSLASTPPTGITLDTDSGVLTVDPNTADRDDYSVDITATNSEGSTTETVSVEVFEVFDVTYNNPVQTVSDGESMVAATPTVMPDPSGVTDGDVIFTVVRVNGPGTASTDDLSGVIQSGLSGTGLSIDGATGEIIGTPNQLGTVSAIVEARGTGTLGGVVQLDVKVTAVEGGGLAGVGGTRTTILQLAANDLAGFGDGAPVPAWFDASAYGNDASEASFDQQPLFQSATSSAAINGQPVLRFDGVDDRLSIDGSSSLDDPEPTLQRAYTFVLRTGASVSSQVIYDEGGNTRSYELFTDGSGNLVADGLNDAPEDGYTDPGSDAIADEEDPTTPWEDEINGDGRVTVTTASPLSPNETYVATLFHDYARGTIELWLNGVSVGSAPGAGRQYGHNIGVIGQGFSGDLGTLYATDASLNTAQRTLLHNALAAQYDVALDAGATDVYAGDESGNGDYDLGVFGIGQIDAANRHVAAGTQGLRLSNASAGIDTDNEFLVVGHRVAANRVNTSDIGGPSGLEARFERTWYVDLNATGVTTANATPNVTFDLSETGLVGPAGDAANYVLLTRSAASGGNWSTTGGTPMVANDDEITFTNVSFTDADEITLGTTDQALSPLDQGGPLVIEGTAGNEGDAAQGELGGDAGYRFVTSPYIGATLGDLEGTSEGGASDSQFLEFDLPIGSMIYQWDEDAQVFTANELDTSVRPVQATSTPLSPTSSFLNGRSALIFFFDDEGTPNADPIDPTLTVEAPDAVRQSVASGTTVTVDGLSNAEGDFNFVGNPFPVPFDLEGLGLSDQDEILNTIQVWNGGAERAEDNAVKGSYIIITEGDGDGPDADSFDDDILAPWQGFFVEREAPNADSDNNGGPSSLTFDVADRTDGPDRIIGARATTGAHEAGRVGFELRVHNSNGDLLARDQAARLTLRSTASLGYDAWDATKLTPLASSFATVSIRSTGPDGTPMRKAAEGLPFDLNESVELPLDIAAQNVEGTATLNVAAWEGVPETWTLHLVDTRGTADPSDDREHVLAPGAAPYSFPIGTEAQGVASIQVAGSQKSPSAGAVSADQTSNGAAVPRFESLDETLQRTSTNSPQARTTEDAETQAAATGSADEAPPRFLVRITPSDAPLPVELAELNATVNNEQVQLEWSTASETNNAGFYVETQSLSPGDSTTTASAWATLGFVEGAGTTDAPQSYQFETDELSYGAHAFRLRQVDTDGTATATEPVTVEVQLDRAYAVEAPYPNPSRGPATLPVTVRETQRVQVMLYDMLGRRIATVYDGEMRGQDTQPIQLNTGRLASGTYFVRVRGEGFITTERLTVIR